MKLLQLTSSNPNFRTINFKDGLNIVVGTQLAKERKKSINGIGKSMSLSLIHYIFGANFKTKSEQKLKDYLAKYGEFTLSFSHKNINYTIKKDFSKPEYYINNEKVTQKDYPNKLKEIFLGEYFPIKTFKSTFNCFARRYSSEVSYYANILGQQGRPIEDYYQQFNNLYLLGIDISLVNKSFEIKEQLDKVKKAEKSIKEYQKALDETNVNDIKDEIDRLNKQVNDFIIAQNYDKLKKEADELTLQINDFRNRVFFNDKKLKIKEANFKNAENINIDVKRVEEIYNEANFFFNEQITKRLEQAQEFHNNLITNIKKRLEVEIKDLKIEIEKLNLEMNNISKKRDEILKDLDNKGALQERDSLKDRIKTLEAEKKDLEKYEHILIDFKKEKSELDVENAKIKQESISYLEKNHDKLVEIESIFRDLIKRFYNTQGGSFKIEEAPTAKYLFNINSHIPKEGSQGVGEVKIFCYDVLLYLLNKDLLNFLAHDGYIFSEMDRRQKSTIFKIILELVQQDSNFQYFLNIGDSTLNEILSYDILTTEEKWIIKDSIILELYDKEPKDWLFGESFD